MNDYELLYLIKVENSDVALEFMFNKYYRFIWKQINLLNIERREFDDLLQEGLLMLHKAIKSFDESRGKTFTRYFELILKRHFYYLKKKAPTYYLHEDASFYEVESYDVYDSDEIEMDFKSQLEKDIFFEYFKNNMKVKEISSKYGYDKKQIYNAIFRIKEKYKNMI